MPLLGAVGTGQNGLCNLRIMDSVSWCIILFIAMYIIYNRTLLIKIYAYRIVIKYWLQVVM